MEENTQIYEEFIRVLLEKGFITNYSCERAKIKNVFEEKFKEKYRDSFHNFYWDMWYYWFIYYFNKKKFFFDPAWINYFSRLQKDKSVKFNETKYFNKKECHLCQVNFPSEKLYKAHKNCLKHKMRLQYIKDKSCFSQCDQLTIKLTEMNGKNPSKSAKKSKCKITSERNKEVTATFTIFNATNVDVKIVEVVSINSILKEIQIESKFTKGSVLKPKDGVKVCLSAYFEHSLSLEYPLVIVVDFPSDGTRKCFLKELPIEITSEYSNLKSSVPFKKPDKMIFPNQVEDLVIKGKKPAPHASYYVEKIPLKPFKIPANFEEVLKAIINSYPSFIDRDKAKLMSSFFNKEFARLLGIDVVLKEENYCKLLKTLADIEEYQMRVDIRDYDTQSTLKHIADNVYKLEVPGLAESRPSLLVNDSVYVKEDINQIFKYQGIVHKVHESSVELGFNVAFSNVFIANKKFHIEFGFSRRPIRVQKQALGLVQTHEITKHFFPKEELKTNVKIPAKEINLFNKSLNEEQKRAVTNILEAESAPYIIFGPPGTGKTVTVVESILQIWKNQPDARILVCGPSNAACNEVAFRLVDIIPKTDIFRLVGNIYSQINSLAKIKNIVNYQSDGSFYMPSMEQLLKYRVMLVTLVTAARIVNGGVPQGHFSHVFIDESGYATESETLIPIAGIISHNEVKRKVAGQIVLAGDPKQLGAIVHSNFVRYCGFDRSMLERLIDSCSIYSRDSESDIQYDQRYITKLVKNYRSHKSILHTANKLFYHDELVAAGNGLCESFTHWEHLIVEGFPVIFHHVEGEDRKEDSSPSFFNIQEIEAVMEYVSKLMNSRANGMQITQDHIGIISPYKKQVEKIKKACQQKKWNKILVGSVEQFQGREKLVIIISTVRSRNSSKFEPVDEKFQLGFLRNPKRFNVALTRAKALLIAVGNAIVLKEDKNWSHFIEYCQNNKSLAGKSFHLKSINNNGYSDEN